MKRLILTLAILLLSTAGWGAVDSLGNGLANTGSTSMADSTEYVIWAKTGASGGTLDSIDAILSDHGDGQDTVWAVVYAAQSNDSSLAPGALLAKSDSILTTGSSWAWVKQHWHFSLALSANTNYWIGLFVRNQNGNNLKLGVYTQADAAHNYAYKSKYPITTPPNPFGTPTGGWSNKFAFEGYFTVTGGSSTGKKFAGVKAQGVK
jgi:hypothetical protein